MRGATIGIVVLGVAGGGCGVYIHGGDFVRTPPASPSATFAIESCSTSSGEEMPHPDIRYYLAEEEGAVVGYEFDPNGSGARLTNSWREGDTLYFFFYVAGSSSWRLVFPDDPARPAMRHIFSSTRTETDDAGVIRPTGDPQASCVLTRL